MDILDSTYYGINKNLLRCLGCWPYQHSREKYVIRCIILCVNVSMIIPEILNLIHVSHDLNKMIDSVPILMMHINHIAKYLTYIFNSNQMRGLFNMIRENWLMVNTDEERIIMHEYAKLGKTISVVTLVAYCASSILYLIVPMIPRVLDALHPLNESRPFVFVFETEYTIDAEKYYTRICIHHYIFALTIMTSIIATDATYGVYAHHVCGMFAIVKHQLGDTQFSKKSGGGLRSDKTGNYRKVVNCIENHKKAIRFCDILESAHVSLMFVILLTSVASLSLTGVQALTHLHEPFQALRFANLCFGHFVHIYYYSWNSQKILSHSSTIYDAAYNAKWYEVMDETPNLLRFMMLRSSKPCIQTAGKMFPLTLINFTVIVKTSMSYFTVLTNFQ